MFFSAYNLLFFVFLSKAVSEAYSSPFEHFTVRGDGAVVVKMNSSDQNGLLVYASAAPLYTGTVVTAKSKSIAGDNFLLFQVRILTHKKGLRLPVS